MNNSLVQPLFDGLLDIVGDVHGEIDALHSLMQHLGYATDGQHPDGRRFVFVGVLTEPHSTMKGKSEGKTRSSF